MSFENEWHFDEKKKGIIRKLCIRLHGDKSYL